MPVSSPLPAPIITGAWYVPPHKVLLRWKTVGQGCAYWVYRMHPDGTVMWVYTDRPWRATSAVVDAAPHGDTQALLSVTAVSANGLTESKMSNLIRMDFNRFNQADTLDPAYR